MFWTEKRRAAASTWHPRRAHTVEPLLGLDSSLHAKSLEALGSAQKANVALQRQNRKEACVLATPLMKIAKTPPDTTRATVPAAERVCVPAKAGTR